MKKLIFLAVALLSVLIWSCTSHDIDMPDWSAQRKAGYADDFNTAFGVSAVDYANHQWGTDIIPMIDITGTSQARTRAADPKGNEWTANGYTVPGAITASELEDVLEVFNKKGNVTYTSLVDWDCFFVQQVYKGTAKYTNHAGGQVTGSEHMDWLCTVTNKYVEVVRWWPYEEKITLGADYDDHINNFNNGNCGAWNGLMLMVNTNSDKFGFKSSEDNGHVFYNFRMEKINGNYYVGFDFEAAGANPNEQVDRDLIYNDWIVKIVPGKGDMPPRPDVDRVRIMCEDLGAAHSDFDYNDVVFDIKFIKNGSTVTADIILQAAGGTLPLTIGGYEVHNLFGVAVTDMVNTGTGPQRDPVPFTVTMPRSDYATAWEAINDLPVIVLYRASAPITLTVSPGAPAEMIVVPSTTAWPGERQSIRNRYPAFVDWISDSTVQWWNE